MLLIFLLLTAPFDSPISRPYNSNKMGCLRNIFMDIFIFIKMLIFGFIPMLEEGFDRIRPLGATVNREGEYAVVTGGNRGIGWHTVKGLIDAGMKVIVGCRDGPSKDILLKKVQAAGFPSTSIEWISLDLSSMDSVSSFARTILNKNVPISILINNAGVMFVPYKETEDGFETHFAVNYLGHFLLTHLLLPRLKAAGTENKAARVINVSSSAHAFRWLCLDDLQGKSYYNAIGAYAQSKAAQIMFTETLDRNLVAENAFVKCFAMHPGFIKTNLYTQSWYSKVFFAIFTGTLFKGDAEGAQRVLFSALSTEVENLNGKYFANCAVKMPAAMTRDRDIQQKLWQASCQLLNIANFGANDAS